MHGNRLPDDVLQTIRTRLNELLTQQSGIYGTLLSSIDGHRIAEAQQRNLHVSKLAAMTSSVIALGESLAKEAEQSQCQFVIVQNRDGYIVTQRLGKQHALTAFATSAVSLGMLLAAVRSTAEALEQALY